jgi:pyrimidine-nucleoside phosphorylase
MHATEIIRKKRDGEELTAAEIAFVIQAGLTGEMTEAQLGAFLMAIYWRGMTEAETCALALEMAHSGEMLDLSVLPNTVDKHSTGGVGDKTTMIVAPLAAAAGVPVAKLSGRALGHTSGTIDRLEAIPGLRTDLGMEKLIDQVQRIGLAVGAQTADLAPADKKLYAMRDSTATVESAPLIAASVMSKKLAGGAQNILLDVKCGRGAFMQDLAQAQELSELMVAIGKGAGRRTRALITAMDEPLGNAIGEGIETWEAIRTLQGDGPADLVELSLLVAAHMVEMGGKAPNIEAAGTLVKELLENGAALGKFRQMVAAQGGALEVFENPEQLYQTKHELLLKAPRSGFIQVIDAHIIGEVARTIVHDHKGGVLLKHKVGEEVQSGEILAILLSDNQTALEPAQSKAMQAFVIGDVAPVLPPVLLCLPIG